MIYEYSIIGNNTYYEIVQFIVELNSLLRLLFKHSNELKYVFRFTNLTIPCTKYHTIASATVKINIYTTQHHISME
jgi:hypothetical protein